jgi:uncharacterized NAD(P)/FAD-binding protein YdhS
VARDLRRPTIADQPPYRLAVLTPQTLAALPERISLEVGIELLEREIEASLAGAPVDWAGLLEAPLDGLPEWRCHVAEHRAGSGSRWQLALAAIDTVFPRLWSRWSAADRERFLASELRIVYQNYSNPLPIESAEEVLALVDSGRVSVRAGLRAVVPSSSGGFRLLYSGEGDAPCGNEIHVSHCIDCTGVGFDVTRDRSPLMRQLLRDGIVEPHAFGGVRLDLHTCRVTAAGDEGEPTTLRDESPSLFVVGHAARGVRYLTSGLGFIRSMVHGVLDGIAADLQRR